MPFLVFDQNIRTVICTTNAIESINARIRRAVNARGHFPNERPHSSASTSPSDLGLWHPPPIDPGFRGRGLAMMEKLAHVFRLVHGPHGTTVVLGWPLPS